MSTARSFSVRLIVVLIVIGIILGSVFAYGQVKSYFIKQFLASFADQKQTVATIMAQKTSWQPQLNSVGSLVAVHGTNLSAEVAGIVDTINFKSGVDVPAGALLATLRPNNDPALLAQLQAVAKLDDVNYQRDLKQLQVKAISQSQVDTDRQTLAGAQAQVQAQQALIAEKQIRAPFAGRAGIRQVDLGQYVPVGTPIVTLQQLNPLFIDFYLPQQALSEVSVGQDVDVSVDAFPGKIFPAKISSINSAVDPTTRSVQIRAALANDTLTLRPGMFASVKVRVGEAQPLVTLPSTAISYNPYGSTAFLVEHASGKDGKDQLVAHQVFVKTGDTRGDQVAILSGIKSGDVVVTAGQLKLHNNALVEINNSLLPPDNPAPNLPNE